MQTAGLREEEENAVCLLRSNEIMTSFQTLKSLAKSRDQEQLSESEQIQLANEDVEMSQEPIDFKDQ